MPMMDETIGTASPKDTIISSFMYANISLGMINIQNSSGNIYTTLSLMRGNSRMDSGFFEYVAQL